MYLKTELYLAKCIYSLIDLSSYMMTKVQEIKKSSPLQPCNTGKFFLSALARVQQDFVLFSLFLLSWIRDISILEWEYIVSIFPPCTVLVSLTYSITLPQPACDHGQLQLKASCLCNVCANISVPFPDFGMLQHVIAYYVQQEHSKKYTIYQVVLQDQNAALYIRLLRTEWEGRDLTQSRTA